MGLSIMMGQVHHLKAEVNTFRFKAHSICSAFVSKSVSGGVMC